MRNCPIVPITVDLGTPGTQPANLFLLCCWGLQTWRSFWERYSTRLSTAEAACTSASEPYAGALHSIPETYQCPDLYHEAV
jgi:hypothetical protein